MSFQSQMVASNIFPHLLFLGLGEVLYRAMLLAHIEFLSPPWNIEMTDDEPIAKLDQQATLILEAKG